MELVEKMPKEKRHNFHPMENTTTTTKMFPKGGGTYTHNHIYQKAFTPGSKQNPLKLHG